MFLSKSKYCGIWQCPKIAWLKKYKPEELTISEATLSRMEAGNEVGDLAMGLFGDYVEVTAYKDDKIDIPTMIARTEEELAKGTPNICEASFSFGGFYCAVDILRKQDDGWAIYEVKSSTHDDKDVYFADVAYQKFVLENCGVRVTGTYLVCLNNEYIFDGELDLHRLFTITDVAESIKDESFNLAATIDIAERLLESEEEPDLHLSVRCQKPYQCAFWKYCSRDIPSPSVFDLYRLSFDKKVAFYYNGIVTYRDVFERLDLSNKIRRLQVESILSDQDVYIDKDGIEQFLNTLSYPLYFLDFESMMPVIPKYVGTRPYQQITFQYSLHYIEREGGKLLHKEFLADGEGDPRRPLAEQLCADIPENVCVLAYNKAFECTRIKELAEAFPDLADHLLNVRSNIKDLLDPFQAGYYYKPAMGGSFSIKSVLPAIFPDDPSLDYHNLEGVHNGGEAMTIFPKIKDMPPAEKEKARHDLLKYCELDTFAMVKVWRELVRAARE